MAIGDCNSSALIGRPYPGALALAIAEHLSDAGGRAPDLGLTATATHPGPVGRACASTITALTEDLDIRRPELRGVRRSGTVRWFKDEKGYGRITADDREVLFVHFSGIVADGYRMLEAGQRVSFVWNGGIEDHGRHRAEDVRVEQ